jgi:hypothetical protein
MKRYQGGQDSLWNRKTKIAEEIVSESNDRLDSYGGRWFIVEEKEFVKVREADFDHVGCRAFILVRPSGTASPFTAPRG